MKHLFFFLFSLALLSGCSRKITSSTKTVIVENKETYEEDLALVRPKYEPRPTETERNPLPPKQSYNPQAEPPHVNVQVDAVINKIANRNKARTTERGYRIQVFSGNDRSEYEQARGYIMQYFPSLETYVSYSQPTYRLRVGDFLNRADAEGYLSSLQSRFVAAKIIYDNVDYKKALTVKQ